jgi:ABC-type transporter MlaC component
MKINSFFFSTIMIKNNHFRKATSYFKQIELITTKSYADRLKMMKEKKVKIQLTKDKEKVNEIIIRIRKKVEAQNKWIK